MDALSDQKLSPINSSGMCHWDLAGGNIVIVVDMAKAVDMWRSNGYLDLVRWARKNVTTHRSGNDLFIRADHFFA